MGADDGFGDFHTYLQAAVADAALSVGGVRRGLVLVTDQVAVVRTVGRLRAWAGSRWRAAGAGRGADAPAWCDLAGVSLRLALQLANEADSLTHSGRGALGWTMGVAAYRRFLGGSVDPRTGEREDYDQALKRVMDEQSLRYTGRRTMPLYRKLASAAFAAAHVDGGVGAAVAEEAVRRYVPARLDQVGGLPVPRGHAHHRTRVLGRLVADAGWSADMATAGAPDRGGGAASMLASHRFDALLGLDTPNTGRAASG
ncbi:hypothetical protein [Streptomyces chumphonensis]|uniref:hypothetical protein n=1 Tax=Streptomyces chumphonensis TaxID=1214925 RepID=UPI003D764181